jgi:hypothetical protein
MWVSPAQERRNLPERGHESPQLAFVIFYAWATATDVATRVPEMLGQNRPDFRLCERLRLLSDRPFVATVYQPVALIPQHRARSVNAYLYSLHLNRVRP